MNRREILTEELTKAEHGAGMVCDDLRHALKEADAVQGMVILDLVKASADLRIRVAQLLGAVESDRKATS